MSAGVSQDNGPPTQEDRIPKRSDSPERCQQATRGTDAKATSTAAEGTLTIFAPSISARPNLSPSTPTYFETLEPVRRPVPEHLGGCRLWHHAVSMNSPSSPPKGLSGRR
jgi:hypothetical protein